jgi:hypothetical protein
MLKPFTKDIAVLVRINVIKFSRELQNLRVGIMARLVIVHYREEW